jgi:hypothetical protein
MRNTIDWLVVKALLRLLPDRVMRTLVYRQVNIMNAVLVYHKSGHFTWVSHCNMKVSTDNGPFFTTHKGDTVNITMQKPYVTIILENQEATCQESNLTQLS